MQRRFFLTLLVGLCLASRAAAHDPPALFRVLSRDPDAVILSTNRGLIVGKAGAETWSLLCSEAFGGVTGARYAAVRLTQGRIVISGERGLRASDDGGCTWRSTGLGDRKTPYVARSPQHPARLYAAVYADGEGGIRRSDDGGETFAPLLATKDTEFVGSLMIAPGEPERIYASITDFSGAIFRTYVARSANGGAHWERSEVPLVTAAENELTLLAVNPRHPDELLARANGKEPAKGERVMLSRDGGKTFTSPITLPVVSGASFSEDGTTAYVSSRDGLHRADGVDRTFAPFGEATRISSVEARDGQLVVGGYYQGVAAGMDGVAVSAADAAPPRFERLMNYDQVRLQLSCPAPATASADCAALWHDWQTEFGLDTVTARPGSDAGTDAGPASSARRDAGCALATERTGGDAEGALFALLVLAWIGRRLRVRPRGSRA